MYFVPFSKIGINTYIMPYGMRVRLEISHINCNLCVSSACVRFVKVLNNCDSRNYWRFHSVATGRNEYDFYELSLFFYKQIHKMNYQ